MIRTKNDEPLEKNYLLYAFLDQTVMVFLATPLVIKKDKAQPLSQKWNEFFYRLAS